MSLSQRSTSENLLYPALTDMLALVHVLAGLCVGLTVGFINGLIIAYDLHP